MLRTSSMSRALSKYLPAWHCLRQPCRTAAGSRFEEQKGLGLHFHELAGGLDSNYSEGLIG